MKTIAPTWYFHVATLAPDGTSVEQLRADVRTASQERIKRELAALVPARSRGVRPLVVFFDDLHWADVSTIDLLNYLTARFEGIAGARCSGPTGRRRWRSRSIRSCRSAVELQSRGMLTELTARVPRRARTSSATWPSSSPSTGFPAELAGLVHARTEGNPLFMADLLPLSARSPRRSCRRTASGLLARSVADIERELPESVRSMIARKIERLDEADRRLLVAASVQGHEFDSATVSEALEHRSGRGRGAARGRSIGVHVFVKLAAKRSSPIAR